MEGSVPSKELLPKNKNSRSQSNLMSLGIEPENLLDDTTPNTGISDSYFSLHSVRRMLSSDRLPLSENL